MAQSPEKEAYYNAFVRCTRPQNPSWRHYGGRGIQFKYASFEEFLSDVGPRPSAEHSLDRINNDGSYEMGNCRWATRDIQLSNRRNPILCGSGKRKQTVISSSGLEKRVRIIQSLRDGKTPSEVALEVGCTRQWIHKLGKSELQRLFPRRVIPTSARQPKRQAPELIVEVPADQPKLPLTAREIELVRFFAVGKTNREVARDFNLSEKTVETHRSNVLRKTGAGNVVRLTLWAVRNDLLPVELTGKVPR